MISIFIFFLLISLSNQWICDFDYGQKCLLGLPSTAFVLLNETSEEPRQPASDITSIQTSNDQGECYFPFQLGSFQMYFCQKSNVNLPSTCPSLNATNPRINCSEGEYGYEKFEDAEIGSRSYQIDSLPNLSIDVYCLRFYYYLSDGISNATIKVLLEDDQTNTNETITIISSYMGNKWHQTRVNFRVLNPTPKMFFVFERAVSNTGSFYIGIDEIAIIDQFCEPLSTTTTTSSSSTTITNNQTISVTSITTNTPRDNSTTTLTVSSSTTTTVGTSTSVSSLTNILSSKVQLGSLVIILTVFFGH